MLYSIQEIEKYLQDIPDTAASMKAAYICSCNKWYDVAPCGFPMQESICCICGKKIGGIDHYPNNREGHFRIFKNETQQNNVMNSAASWLKGRIVRHKTIQTLKQEFENTMKEEHKGIKSISLDFFNDENKNVRELNQISYRILSFIFFSYLFSAKILGYINDNTINENLFPFN